MKLVTCVTTCDRPLLLRNAVESRFDLFPFGDLLVVDDASERPEQLSYLEELERRGATVIRGRGGRSRFHGSLYTGMNAALELGLERGCDYLQFVQDDMHFVWHDPDVLGRAELVFERRPDAAQVNLTFFKEIVADMPKRLELFADASCYWKFWRA